ncbi:hypothetical protein HYW41_02655 [Candidatus Daviesbacteria bacterium]|nr:hypothetical protein [Candidatus Daviesbacteria bacterium]
MRNVEARPGLEQLSVEESFYAATIGDPRCENPMQQSANFARGLRERAGKPIVYTAGVLTAAGFVALTSWGGAYLAVEGLKFAHKVFNELPGSVQDGLILSGVILGSAGSTIYYLHNHYRFISH